MIYLVNWIKERLKSNLELLKLEIQRIFFLKFPIKTFVVNRIHYRVYSSVHRAYYAVSSNELVSRKLFTVRVPRCSPKLRIPKRSSTGPEGSILFESRSLVSLLNTLNVQNICNSATCVRLTVTCCPKRPNIYLAAK